MAKSTTSVTDAGPAAESYNSLVVCVRERERERERMQHDSHINDSCQNFSLDQESQQCGSTEHSFLKS